MEEFKPQADFFRRWIAEGPEVKRGAAGELPRVRAIAALCAAPRKSKTIESIDK